MVWPSTLRCGRGCGAEGPCASAREEIKTHRPAETIVLMPFSVLRKFGPAQSLVAALTARSGNGEPRASWRERLLRESEKCGEPGARGVSSRWSGHKD